MMCPVESSSGSWASLCNAHKTIHPTNIKTLIHVFVRYMDTHPTYLDETRNVAMFRALYETYPCKKKAP